MPKKTSEWQEQDRTLVNGDVLRTKVGNKQNPHYGEYCYGVCTGDGFGTSMDTMGNAIYMSYQSFDLQKVIKAASLIRKGTPAKLLGGILGDEEGDSSSRWERFWGIEYLRVVPEVEVVAPTTERHVRVSYGKLPELGYKNTTAEFDPADDGLIVVQDGYPNGTGRRGLGLLLGEIVKAPVGATMTMEVVEVPITGASA